MEMTNWKIINNVEDLPKKDGEYIVVVHFRNDYGAMFIDIDEIEEVTSAYFRYEQKIWELSSEYRINALLPIFNVFDTESVDYINAWHEMPELPKFLKEDKND